MVIGYRLDNTCIASPSYAAHCAPVLVACTLNWFTTVMRHRSKHANDTAWHRLAGRIRRCSNTVVLSPVLERYHGAYAGEGVCFAFTD